MSGVDRFQAGDLLWAWLLAGGNADGEMAKAIDLYQQRFGCLPFLVICPDGLKLKPVTGLKIVPHSSLPNRAVYFALTGHHAVSQEEVMSIE